MSDSEEFQSLLSSLLLPGKVLDLGCGERHYTRARLDTTWVDIDPEHARDPRVIIMDITSVPDAFRLMRFTTILMIDVIEHVRKDSGEVLLNKLAGMALRLILFTPVGCVWVKEGSTSPHEHKCGWFPAELEARGFVTKVWPSFHRGSDYCHGAFLAWNGVER
jgi:hypothetical protein